MDFCRLFGFDSTKTSFSLVLFINFTELDISKRATWMKYYEMLDATEQKKIIRA